MTQIAPAFPLIILHFCVLLDISSKGKVAVITGAARGMGKAIAKTFAYEGAAVGLLDIQEEELNQTVNEIQAENGKALGLVTDVRYYDQVERAAQSVMEGFGNVDILVNSAGLSGNGLVHKISEADWDMCFDVNVKGTFLLCKAVVPIMLKQNKVRLSISLPFRHGLEVLVEQHAMALPNMQFGDSVAIWLWS